MKIELTRELAEVIVKAEDACYSEGIGPIHWPGTPDRREGPWFDLLETIEEHYDISCDYFREYRLCNGNMRPWLNNE